MVPELLYSVTRKVDSCLSCHTELRRFGVDVQLALGRAWTADARDMIGVGATRRAHGRLVVSLYGAPRVADTQLTLQCRCFDRSSRCCSRTHLHIHGYTGYGGCRKVGVRTLSGPNQLVAPR